MHSRIVILEQAEFKRNRGCSDPAFLADFLKKNGFAAVLSSARELCDASTYAGADVVILPYGPVFPVEARSPFLDFLASGGHFLSTGGYAFDSLVRRAGGRFEDLSPFEKRRIDLRMNTRFGLNEDHNVILPDQIGIFQPGWKLEHVSSLRTAPESPFDGPPVDVPLACEGHIACCSNMADRSSNYASPQWEAEIIEPSTLPVGRWFPLLQCYDRYSRPRGAAGAIRANYDGPYSGSIWAYFGVENIDLFSGDCPELMELLLRILRFQCAGAFLAPCRPKDWVYDPGDNACLPVHLVNVAEADNVTLEISEYRTGKKLALLEAPRRKRVSHKTFALFEWSVEGTDTDLIRLTFLLRRAGKTIDRLQSGIMIRRRDLLTSGMDLKFHDNYFHVADRPMFLFGTDSTSRHHVNDSQHPISWWLDAQAASDGGVTIFEVLHQQEGVPEQNYGDRYKMTEEQLRSYDGMIQHTQKLSQIYMGGLLISHDLAVDDEHLERAAAKVRQFVEHTRDCRAMIHYLNGDYRVTLDDRPFIRKMFSRFLQNRYPAGKSPDGRSFSKENECPAISNWSALGSNDWTDMRAEELSWFKIHLLKRWNNYYADICKRISPDRPVTSEFYPVPYSGIDCPLGMGNLDFSNIGYFSDVKDDLTELRGVLCLNDLRLYGKSVSLGEFGVHDCPTWDIRNGVWLRHSLERTRRQKMDLFDNAAHQTLAAGGSRAQNWSLKDDSEICFPWGLMGPNERIAREQFKLFRNLSWLFRTFPLRYERPEVLWVVPDYLRLALSGDALTKIYRILNLSADSLQGAGVRFGMINQTRLADALPESARALVFPLPFVLTDEEYDVLKKFVEGGGALYISGDFSFDRSRKRSREFRLRELAGVELSDRQKQLDPFEWVLYPWFARENCGIIPEPKVPLTEYFASVALHCRPCDDSTEVLARTRQGRPVLFRKKSGSGFTMFAAAPAENPLLEFPDETASNLYRFFLDEAGIKTLPRAPDVPHLRPARLTLEDGGLLEILSNVSDRNENAAFGSRVRVNCEITRQRSALIRTDKHAGVLALEASGSVNLDGGKFAESSGRFALCALDGKDVRESRSLAFLSLECRKISFYGETLSDKIVELGDIYCGRWRRCLRPETKRSEAGISFSIPEDLSLDMGIIASPDNYQAAAETIALWMSRPDRAARLQPR